MAKPRIKKTGTTTSSPTPHVVTRGDIARRAYDLYLARGCEHGHDLDDWLRAERELSRNGAAA